MSKAPASKKTVYIDVDEEITGIIDKVRSTPESIIALVLPKRASVLQSVVNMKLLKRAADQSDKRVVLITSESSLMPLAGAAGIHVAANLQSRPYLPSATPKQHAAESSPEPEEKDVDPTTPIGVAAGLKSDKEPIEIDNTKHDEEALAAASAAAATTGKAGKLKKDKSKKVPDFHKFRALLFAGIAALILLIGFGYWALAIAPKATVTLRTETSETDTSAEFTADTSADEIDLESSTLPARQEELKKVQTEKVPATGEKDNGTKAGGTVTLRNCTDNKVTIPAGTGISSGQFTFITQSAVQLDDGDFSSPSSGSQCRTSGDHVGKVNVVAKENGEQYNLSARSYTINGVSGNVFAQGDQMTGGTSKVVKVVSATDVENAKKKIADKQNQMVQELKTTLQSRGYIGLVDTFSNGGDPKLTATPAVNTEAAEVTVSGEITYSMLGVKESDLKKIVEAASKDKVDTSKQSILNYGFDEASFNVGNKRNTLTDITVSTTLVAGPEINQDSLKQELAGKKSGDAENTLKSRPGITEARVELKPFWVGKIPGKAEKVQLVIEQADGKQINP